MRASLICDTVKRTKGGSCMSLSKHTPFVAALGLLTWLNLNFIFAQTTAAPSLMNAVRRGDTAAVQARLSAGADPNEVENSVVKGCSALMEAANSGQVEIVQMLLKAGANVNATTEYGGTAFDVAVLS